MHSSIAKGVPITTSTRQSDIDHSVTKSILALI
jgi:hypothetical protein